MSVAHEVEALLAQLGSPNKLRIAPFDSATRPLELAWPGLDDVLPDGGLPCGVVELAAPHALGGSTSIALAAVRAAQTRGANVWCAWIDPEATLHAPGAFAAGVDLARMFVVRPSRAQLGRVAVKVVGAKAFEVVVVDYDAVPSAEQLGLRGKGFEKTARGGKRLEKATRAGNKRAWAPEVLVRKLALAAESSSATVLLLTDSTRPRSLPWPVALRLELSRPSRRELAVRVAKDKRGRIGRDETVLFRPVAREPVG